MDILVICKSKSYKPKAKRIQNNFNDSVMSLSLRNMWWTI